MNNFDELGKIIIQYNYVNGDDFICIGYGTSHGLSNRYDIHATQIFSQTGIGYDSGFSGTDESRLYFITKSLYIRYSTQLSAHLSAFTMLDAIKIAESLIGKLVMGQEVPFLVEALSVFSKFSCPTWINDIGQDFLAENGWVVVVENNDEFCVVTKDLNVVSFVKLNDEYDAIIEGDYVKVGCQTIHKDKVIELAKRLQ